MKYQTSSLGHLDKALVSLTIIIEQCRLQRPVLKNDCNLERHGPMILLTQQLSDNNNNYMQRIRKSNATT